MCKIIVVICHGVLHTTLIYDCKNSFNFLCRALANESRLTVKQSFVRDLAFKKYHQYLCEPLHISTKLLSKKCA